MNKSHVSNFQNIDLRVLKLTLFDSTRAKIIRYKKELQIRCVPKRS